MNVQELEDLLARLPADMPVYVSVWPRTSTDRLGARHVTIVDKRPRQRAEQVTIRDGDDVPASWRGQRTLLVPGDGTHTIPSAVVLRGDGPLWFDDEPDVELRGRWPRAARRRGAA